jgi:hypothetical protein
MQQPLLSLLCPLYLGQLVHVPDSVLLMLPGLFRVNYVFVVCNVATDHGVIQEGVAHLPTEYREAMDDLDKPVSWGRQGTRNMRVAATEKALTTLLTMTNQTQTWSR